MDLRRFESFDPNTSYALLRCTKFTKGLAHLLGFLLTVVCLAPGLALQYTSCTLCLVGSPRPRPPALPARPAPALRTSSPHCARGARVKQYKLVKI